MAVDRDNVVKERLQTAQFSRRALLHLRIQDSTKGMRAGSTRACPPIQIHSSNPMRWGGIRLTAAGTYLEDMIALVDAIELLEGVVGLGSGCPHDG